MLNTDTDYGYYYNNYCGGGQGLLSKEDFDGVIQMATQKVGDYITYDGDYPSFEDDVRKCICRVAEFISQNSAPNGIKSENTDGYSVTYNENFCQEREIRRIVSAQLKDTGMIFMGV